MEKIVHRDGLPDFKTTNGELALAREAADAIKIVQEVLSGKQLSIVIDRLRSNYPSDGLIVGAGIPQKPSRVWGVSFLETDSEEERGLAVAKFNKGAPLFLIVAMGSNTDGYDYIFGAKHYGIRKNEELLKHAEVKGLYRELKSDIVISSCKELFGYSS